jgi:hypothetical protein
MWTVAIDDGEFKFAVDALEIGCHMMVPLRWLDQPVH